MQGFYFFVKFGLVLIYVLMLYRKKFSLILLRKYMFNSLLAFFFFFFFFFFFVKHVPSQVLKDFSVENLETAPRSIYLELLIIGIYIT